MNKKLVIIIGVALLAATGSTYVFYRMISRQVASSASANVSRQEEVVVVAARGLQRGGEIKPEDLVLEPWSGASLPDNVFTSTQPLVGKLVKFDVVEGEPLRDFHVLSATQQLASSRIPAGKRAVSVHVHEFAGVTKIFEPGDRVDVLVATGSPGAGKKNVTLKTILQDVEVLTTGRGDSTSRASRERPVATLLVDAGNAELLSAADHAGYIRLVLRNPLDDSINKDSSGTGLSDVLGNGAAQELPNPVERTSKREEIEPSSVDAGSQAAPETGLGENSPTPGAKKEQAAAESVSPKE